MSKRIMNFVVVVLFCFFAVYLGLKIGYDNALIDKADDELDKSTKETDAKISSTTHYPALDLVDQNSIRF